MNDKPTPLHEGNLKRLKSAKSQIDSLIREHKQMDGVDQIFAIEDITDRLVLVRKDILLREM